MTDLIRCLALIPAILAVLLLAAPGRSAPRPCPQACKDAHVLAFFRSHRALARTPAGRVAILEIRVRRLGEVVRSLQAARSTPEGAIRYVFGQYAEQALAVSYCETGGTYDTGAQNGQFLGLFQMGDYARGRYGHGSDALTQARAAYAYFADSGYGWGPWECRPG